MPLVVEPVNWRARLVRSDGVRYTEVGGLPVVVQCATGEVRGLGPGWVATWASLDGRPVADALGIDPDELAPTDARNLIEVLRRLKADGLIRDADPREPAHERHDLDAVTPTRSTVTVAGAARFTRDGTMLTITPDASGTVGIELRETPRGVVVAVRRRLRRRLIDRIEVVPPVPGSPTAARNFAGIVRAVTDREELLKPGLVDLLAGVAERAVAPGSPPS